MSLHRPGAYNGFVAGGSNDFRATLVAYYCRKPPQLLDFVERVQRRIAQGMGTAFKAYQSAQVHATIVGLDTVENNGRRRQPGETLVTRVRELLRQTRLLPMEIQVGGFYPHVDYGFTSRGLSPSIRSFSLRDGAALGIGWPVVDGRYPNSLDSLRREFRQLDIIHKYHRNAADVDNDLYFVLGHYSQRVRESLVEAVETDIRQYFAASISRIPLRLDDLSIAHYADETLPPASTVIVPVRGDDGAAVGVPDGDSLEHVRAS